MVDSSRVRAISTVLSAVLDASTAAPEDLGGALGELGVDPADTPRASDAVRRASTDVLRLRRRERELAALFSSARELAEVRDRDALLDRLVHRAHEMMDCDVTYLSVLDPDSRELHIRSTAGAVSPEFRDLHVPAGRGLVSEIVESREARWVGRYGEYRASRHEMTIDRAVDAEALVSLLGVPLLTDQTVLGVLFVATRTEAEFTPEQVSLLSALADHASVVLQTAAMLEGLRRSEDEARRALDRLTGHLAERDRAGTVHQQLVQAVLRGGGFDQIAMTLSGALRREVTILDHAGRALAHAPGPPPSPTVTLPQAVLVALERSRESGRCEPVDDQERSWATAITAGADSLGGVLLGTGDFPLGPVDRRTVERAAQVCALLELQHTAVADTERRLQADLVVDILEAGRERAGDIERRARSFGILLSELDTVHVLALPGAARSAAVRHLMLVLKAQGIVGDYRGYLTAIVRSDRPQVAGGALSSGLRRHTGGPVLCVTAPLAAAPGELGERFVLAMRTARLLEAIGIVDRSVSTDEFLPYAAIFDADPRTLSSFLDATIGAVRAHDRARGTELLNTLQAFVRCNASPTRTARMLHFHTNTVLQRLDRLGVILGPDWREDERFFRISLAVRLDAIRADLGAQTPGPPGRSSRADRGVDRFG